jgi:NADH-quinone oxidoreductase subunit C
MNYEEIFNRLKDNFGDSVTEIKKEAVGEEYIVISPDKVDEICLFLRDEEDLKFDELMNLSGIDYTKGSLAVAYHLYSFTHNHKVNLKTYVTAENPHVKSVSQIWLTADWHEREAYDIIGIIFDGHPNLIRILLPYDWEGHPLRKDYEVPEFYNGMKVPY